MINSQCNVLTTDSEVRGHYMPLHTYHALIFNLKVDNGTYQTEQVNCYCGSDNYRQITDKDRYGINYSLCLCKDCGILYANPRLTEESLKKFYAEDYRNIYDDHDEVAESCEKISGITFIRDLVWNTLKEFEKPVPKVVFEIGCGAGELLKQFSDCETLGVDYDSKAILNGLLKHRNVKLGGIEVLEADGRKADLIVMNHVIEHMTDIERDLGRIRNLLSDDGVLYVAVPGLYSWDKKSLIQNAHNYQFNGNTLWYVMRTCGFEDYYLTEGIESLWHKSDFMVKSNKNSEDARFVESFLLSDKFLAPKVRVNCKFSLSDRRENLRKYVESGMPQITGLIQKHPGSDAVIVCGGPSIEKYPKKIKKLQKRGAKVYAIERMYGWCLDHNIVPDYIIVLDASDDVIQSFDRIHPDTTHIIASQCRADLIDKLKDYKSYYFLILQKGINYAEIFKDKNEPLTMINSASSVSLCSMSIAMTLGAKRFHIFGFDCHVTKGNYANGITGVGDIKDTYEIEIDNRVFKTTTTYFAFLQQFFELMEIGKANGLVENIKIYGDSMVKWASKKDIDGDKPTN
jgi:SAM-dependent methyltransferase